MTFDLKPHMTEREQQLLARWLPARARVLEFGAGGSTRFFFEQGVARLCSVESDKSWLDKLAQDAVVSANARKKRWLPIHMDIGRVGDWGMPADPQPDVRWLAYHQDCWALMGDHDFNFVLVDGRFRVACFCQSLLRCPVDNLVLAVHDFWDRPAYHAVLAFVDVLAASGTLMVCKPKQGLERQKVEELLALHRFVYL